MNKKLENSNVRISLFLVVIALVFFALIIARTFQLALSEKVDGINLQEFASSRTTKNEVLKAKRGTIYDKNGTVLVQNVSSYTLIAYLSSARTTNIKNPQHVVDKEYTAEMLSTVLDLSKEQILKYLSKENVYQTEFGSKGRGLTELTKDAILALGLPGIDFIETQKRYYPYGDFASYTLGYAKTEITEKDDGSSMEAIIGEMGIEKQFDSELQGEDGYTFYQKDRAGYKIAGTKEVTVSAKDGKDVYLTIDSNIQLFVERALDKAGWYNFEWSTILVADAKTGAILASASTPSFDPNVRNITNYFNYNTSYPYEPGSTMKIFSYMATMENGNYDGNATYRSGVYVTKDGTEIGDWNRNGWGDITFNHGFVLSSNVGVINLINRYISGAVLKTYYNKLGFGSKTGIELPNEKTGKIAFKYETEILNAGFGQGITTTPIQNIKALTSLTNNGVLMQPYIVDKIVDSDINEVVYQGEKKELDKVASKDTVNKMKELMRLVIQDPSGTGHIYNMDGYDLIAKTGTAQVADKNGYGSSVIRSFAGIYPGDDPRIIIYYSSKDNGSSGVYAMRDAVKDLIANVSKYLEIDGSKNNQASALKDYEMPSFINKNTSEVVKTLGDLGLNYVTIGNGNKIIKQYPNVGTKVSELDKIYLVTNDNNLIMPNVVGYSVSDAKVLLNLLGINYSINGNGYITSQSIPGNTVLKKEDIVSLEAAIRF